MSELKPCPFCGGTKIRTIEGRAYCVDCGLNVAFALIGKWNTRPIEDALQAEIDRLKETNKELLERLALLEKKIPLIEIINGMFPMWIAAMSFCEHGKHDSLMRMRNYYNGRDNLLTSDQIHVMFSLIRGVGDERK